MKKLYLILLLLITPIIYSAVPSDSAYNSDTRGFMVEDTLNDAADTPTMILCFMRNLRPDLLVNKGTYLAQVDEEECKSDGQIKSGPQSQDKASASGSADGAASKSYTDAISIITRATASADMLGKTWLTVDGGPAGDMHVFIKTVVTSGPTSSNPYGVFRMDYTAVDGNGDDMMYGVLQANSSGVLNWYEDMIAYGMIDSLSLDQDLDAGTGKGAVRKTDTQSGAVYAYGYAYDTDGYCRTQLSKNGGSPDDSDEYCFDTRESEGVKTIWDYDLYDSVTGNRHDLAVKGFQVRATVSDTKYFGFANYHGLHFDSSIVANITDGYTITRDNGGAAGIDYTVNITRGKLQKITKSNVSLASMNKYPMNSFFSNSNLGLDASEYKFYYDNSASKFILTHNRVCTDGQGCFDTPLDPELEFTVAQWIAEDVGGIGAWVPGLGGVYISSGALSDTASTSPGSSVEIESEELVGPESYPDTLYCVSNCFTKGSISNFITKIQAQTHTSSDHPYTTATYRESAVTAANLAKYTKNGLTYQDNLGLPAEYPDGLSSDDNDNIGQTAANWGVRTGALLTDPAGFQCASWRGSSYDYCTDGLWDGSISEYYVWRTGHKRWDRKFVIKSGAEIINFSAPTDVYYQVPDVAANGNFAGKEVRLEFGGSGSLWGFPGACFNASTGAFTSSCGSYGSWLPWVNRFEIPFNESTGFVMTGREQTGTKYLVKGRFGAVFLVPLASKIGSLTLGTAADLTSDDTVNVGPNGTAANYIGAIPTKPDTVSVKQGELL